MGLFTNYKKLNEQNKSNILNLIEQLMNIAPDQINELNNMKNTLLSQAPSDNKELKKIDEQILAALNEAKSLYTTGNGGQGRAYIVQAKQELSKRLSATPGGLKPNKVPKVNLSPDLVIEVMLAKAQDAVANAAKTYNETMALAQRGDIAAQAKAKIDLQRYNIAMQNFNAISANLNREAVAKMMQEFTEEQRQRIANRSISDQDLEQIVQSYQEASNKANQEAADASILEQTIAGNASQSSMQGMPTSLNIPGQGQASGVQGMPTNLNIPGQTQVNSFGTQPSANPFETSSSVSDELGLGAVSDNELRATKSMLENQIDRLKDELEEKRADRKELDSRLKSLLEKHEKLPAAQAQQYESEIDSLMLERENSDFELANIQQEVLQLQENKGIVVKLLTVKTRTQREQMLKDRFGNNFNVENFAMLIANAQEKFNQDLQRADDANAVARAGNTNSTRTTTDIGASFNTPQKRDYGDLKRSFGIEENK